ncbi:hypothetical protein OTU49_001864, partial [Cherax quadricarinatus]
LPGTPAPGSPAPGAPAPGAPAPGTPAPGTPGARCVDPNGLAHKHSERVLFNCKVNICRNGAFVLIKDAGDKCCKDRDVQNYYRNGEKYQKGTGLECMSYICINSQVISLGPCV